MSNITFHRRHMTAVPTDLLLDPMISIEANGGIPGQVHSVDGRAGIRLTTKNRRSRQKFSVVGGTGYFKFWRRDL